MARVKMRLVLAASVPRTSLEFFSWDFEGGWGQFLKEQFDWSLS